MRDMCSGHVTSGQEQVLYKQDKSGRVCRDMSVLGHLRLAVKSQGLVPTPVLLT